MISINSRNFIALREWILKIKKFWWINLSIFLQTGSSKMYIITKTFKIYSLTYLCWVHNNSWNEIQENMIAISPFRLGMWKGNFQFIHGFEKHSFSFVANIFKRCFLSYQIRMTYYGSNEKSVVSDFFYSLKLQIALWNTIWRTTGYRVIPRWKEFYNILSMIKKNSFPQFHLLPAYQIFIFELIFVFEIHNQRPKC